MDEARKYCRVISEGAADPTAFQTAIVRFAPAGGADELTVDFIGCVHIGDRAYFEALNTRFATYDAVLFELVASDERLKKAERKEGAHNVLTIFQTLSSRVLAIEHQLDHIDYSATNFVHADLSPKELLQAVERRGYSGFTFALAVIREMMAAHRNKPEADGAESSPFSMSDVLQVLDGKRARELKVVLGRSLASQHSADQLASQLLLALLIEDRNRAALEVLKREISAGKKKIAIFYGAGHGADFEARLKSEFGLLPVSEEWITAWDLTPRETKS